MVFLARRAPTNPASRGYTYARYPALLPLAHPKRSVGFRHTAGRGVSGVRTVFSKGGYLHHRTFRPLLAAFSWAANLGLVAKIQPRSKARGSAVALVRTALGAWYYIPAAAPNYQLAFFRSVPLAAAHRTLVQPGRHWL